MTLIKKLTQALLGLALAYAGTTHLSSNRQEFQAQVPTWLPLDADFVVIASGIVEITLGLSLLTLWRYRQVIGLVVAIFFILIFPGNINQYINHIDAFGLDTDQARFIRLLFQPLLVAWALWSTGAWQKLIKHRN
ncbi:unannotated protein [freshwater metagenome]|uniref:Unannotated protein n=1 Tax=freshwater metagenome TaxID=449393 RepID=A0A6J6CQE8_9ZZZZ|nr:hypothetical protein [Actinomycetota bacterium]